VISCFFCGATPIFTSEDNMDMLNAGWCTRSVIIKISHCCFEKYVFYKVRDSFSQPILFLGWLRCLLLSKIFSIKLLETNRFRLDFTVSGHSHPITVSVYIKIKIGGIVCVFAFTLLTPTSR